MLYQCVPCYFDRNKVVRFSLDTKQCPECGTPNKHYKFLSPEDNILTKPIPTISVSDDGRLKCEWIEASGVRKYCYGTQHEGHIVWGEVLETKLVTTCKPYPIKLLRELANSSEYKPTIEEIKQFRKDTGIEVERCVLCLKISKGDFLKAKDINMMGV